MALSNLIRTQVQEKSKHYCCLCFQLGIQAHHIVPEAEDGPDDFDNAAPLCPNCHRIYGNNPDHRRMIRWKRDDLYNILETHPFGPPSHNRSRLPSQARSEREVATICEVYTLLASAHRDTRLLLSDLGWDTDPPKSEQLATAQTSHGVLNKCIYEHRIFLEPAILEQFKAYSELERRALLNYRRMVDLEKVRQNNHTKLQESWNEKDQHEKDLGALFDGISRSLQMHLATV